MTLYYDVMFKTWADSVKNKIVSRKATYYKDSTITYDPSTDTIHYIPVNSPEDVLYLKSISDIKYLGSFGHGKQGKIWWSYKDATSPQGHRSVTTGIPYYRLNDATIVDAISMKDLQLDFNKCHFVVEFYHCYSAEEYSADRDGNLVFSGPSKNPDSSTTSTSLKTSIIIHYKSLLETVYAGTKTTFNINGSVEGISNGIIFNRGYPNPVEKIKHESK